MITSESFIRVRYAETDRMGYAYHGHYAEYFEIARTDWCREIGLSYKEIEDKGILMPVMELNIQYRLPAFYDDMLHFRVYLKNMPGWRMTMEAESFNEAQKLTARYRAELGFVNKANMKPIRVPDFIYQSIEENWPPQHP